MQNVMTVTDWSCSMVRSRASLNSQESLRILVVEDDAVLATTLGEMLVRIGHNVCATASTQTDAIDAALQHRPDLMIVDCALRQGTGMSAVDEILRDGPMPHFFLTGNTGKIRATRPDAVVLQKPFRTADLTKAIAIALKTAAV